MFFFLGMELLSIGISYLALAEIAIGNEVGHNLAGIQNSLRPKEFFQLGLDSLVLKWGYLRSWGSWYKSEPIHQKGRLIEQKDELIK